MCNANMIARAVITAAIRQVLGFFRCVALKGGVLASHPVTRFVIEIIT